MLQLEFRSAVILLLLAFLGSPQAVAQAIPVGATSLKSWGENSHGKLGDGSSTSRSSAVEVSGLVDVIAAGCGEQHSIALKRDGTVWTWGRNNSGQLGDGTSMQGRLVPGRVPNLSGVVAISTGAYHCMALLSSGAIMAWGSNASFGQLGDGTTAAIRTLPVSVAGLSGVVAIACGGTHSVALKRDGSVWAWGSNFSGRLGLGTKNYTANPTPAMVPGLTDVIAISAGADHTMALKRDGTVWAWGENNRGQVGDGTPTAQQPITMQCFSPVRAAGLSAVAAISAGASHSMALKRDGTIWQWGKDSVTANIMRGPVAVSGLADVIAISSGGGFQHVLKRNGTVWSWGMNYIGQACDGTTNTPVRTPVQSVGLTDVVAIYAGGSNSFAIIRASPRPLLREPRLTPKVPLAPR